MTPALMSCLHCGETIVFGPPWQHVSDGSCLRTRIDADGIERDDHYATPDYGDS